MLGRRLVVGFIAATLAAGGMAAAAVAPSAAAPAAGDWSRPARVWSAPAGTSAPVDLGQVVDSRGVVTATWETSARGIWRVMASRLGSNGWSKPVTVFRAQAGATELDVRTAAGPADEVVVAVAALGGGGVKMSAARFSAGSWSPAVALGDYPDPSSDDAGRVTAFATLADGSGVSVLWQVRNGWAPTVPIVARGLPSGASGWTPATVLDDAATGSFSLVRDGRDTVRAAWLHGQDVVTAQGSASGWGARETIGTRVPGAGAIASSDLYDWPAVQAAADLDGTVLVTWMPRAAQGTCPPIMTALRSATGWAPAVPTTDLSAASSCVTDLFPFVGRGLVPTVTGVDPGRWVDRALATTWSGSTWGPVHETSGHPQAAGSTLLAINRPWSTTIGGAKPDISWLTSSTLTPGGWTEPQRISDAGWGWVEDVASTTAADGSFVIVYSKLRPWRYNAIWSMTYANGQWSTAEVLGPRVRTPKGSFGADLASPVVAPDGRVTVAWILGDGVFASRSR